MNELVLKDYQVEAISQMNEIEEKEGKGGILSHEMGLGKTITMASFLINKRKMETPEVPDLIICPLSVVIQWKREILRVCKDQKVLVYHGSERTLEKQKNYSFIVCTYHCLVTRELEDYEWNRVALDEAHIIRNGSESNHRSIPKKVIGAYNLKPRSKIRWCITGTPFNNRMEDVRSLMKFLGYSEHQNIHKFVDTCVLQKNKEGVIEPFSVHLVGIENPSDEVMERYSREYLFNYRKALALLRHANPIDAKRLYIMAMNCLTILRVFCDLMVPSVMSRVAAERGEDEEEGYEYYYEHPMAKEEMIWFYDTSPKIRTVYENIMSWIPRSPHGKILIFSSFVTTLEVLETILNEKNREIKTFKYTGKMNKDQREESITRFCDVSSDSPAVLLASIGAGNCGINLVPCATVFIIDIPLNPFEILQAVNRVHRLTQTSHVNVVKFYMKGMIEKDILFSHNRKIKEASGAGLKVDLIDVGKD